MDFANREEESDYFDELDQIEVRYIITELRTPNATRQSLFCNFSGSESPVLILSKLDRLEFYDISINGEAQMTEMLTVPVKNPVVAINKLNLGAINDVLLVLDQAWDLSLIYLQNGTIYSRSIMLLSSEGQQFSIDSNPMLVVDKSPQTKYFVLHNFQGVLSLFIVNQDFDIAGSNKKRGRSADSDIVSVYSIAIGSIVVLQMEMLENDILAVLYRDFNFNYSLRYYKIEAEIQKITLIKTLNTFQVPPTCLIPTSDGGVLVLSSVSMFYFPSNNSRYVTLAESADESVTISSNVVSKDLSKDRSRDDKIGLFLAFDVIDDKRFILTTNEGMTYMLYFDADTKNDSTYTVINHFQLILLGKTSSPIARGLHHLTDTFFFQASSVPADILFQVNPKKPFINIVYSGEPSGPILDVDLVSGDDMNELQKLVTLQGNKHNSMLTYPLLEKIPKFEQISETLFERGIQNIVPISGSREFVCEFTDGRKEIFKYQNHIKKVKNKYSLNGNILHAILISHTRYILTTKGVYVENECILEEDILFGQILDNQNILILSKDMDLALYNKSKLISKHILSGSEVCGFDVLKCSDSEIMYAIAKVDCTVQIWSVSASSNHVMVNEMSNEGITTSIKICQQNDVLNVLFITSDYRLVQYSVGLKTKALVRNRRTKCELHFAAKLEKGIENDLYLVFKDTICSLDLDIALNHYVPNFRSAKIDTNDLFFLDNQSFGSLPTVGDSLNLYKLQSQSQLNAQDRIGHQSPKTILKLITVTMNYVSYGASLVVEELLESSKKQYSIEFYDLQFSKRLASNTFDEGVEISDIIDAGFNSAEECILAISKTGTLFEISIEDNQLSINAKNIKGLLNSPNLEIGSISKTNSTHTTQNYVLVGNMIVPICRTSEGWELKCAPCPCPSFGILQANGDVVADAAKGLFQCTVGENPDPVVYQFQHPYKMKMSKLQQSPEFCHTFTTAMSSTFKGILIGDALGNISLANDAFFNVGDQVNCIKGEPDSVDGKIDLLAVVGTLHGGLYQISSIDDEEELVFGRLQACRDELVTLSKGNDPDQRWKYSRGVGKVQYVNSRGVMNLNLIKRFLTLYNADTPLDELTEYSNCVEHVDVLADFYNHCTGLETKFRFVYERT